MIGLTEMFPEPVRNGFGHIVNGSLNGVKNFYGFSRSALWVLFTSSAVLLAPLALEMERSQMEEFNKQQQRQVFTTIDLNVNKINTFCLTDIVGSFGGAVGWGSQYANASPLASKINSY